MKFFKIFLLICVCDILVSCCFGFNTLNPLNDREGELYTYTRSYLSGEGREPRFYLLGKNLLISDRGNPGLMIGNPLKILSGAPLAFIEGYIICPVIDTVLFPYDIYKKIDIIHRCNNEGVLVQVLNDIGKPATNEILDVNIRCELHDRHKRLRYDGSVAEGQVLNMKFITDENGEFYIPILIETRTAVNLTYKKDNKTFHSTIYNNGYGISYWNKTTRNIMYVKLKEYITWPDTVMKYDNTIRILLPYELDDQVTQKYLFNIYMNERHKRNHK